MRFFTTLKLGPNREMTPDGFTIFRNVSISRVGEQVYGPNEGTGIDPGEDGLVHIMRTPEEVFRPESLASGNAKPLVILHPDSDVSPETWRDLTHGVMFNLRRGSGDQADECVADVMVCSPEALREIDLGLREVSLGYDADYFQTGPGHGEQRNILINHIALVPAGRCGPQCAVRDKQLNQGACNMKVKKKSFVDRLITAVRNKDEEAAKKLAEEIDDEESEGENGSGETHIHVHTGAPAPKAEDEESEDPTEKRFKALEDAIKDIRDGRKRDEGLSEEEKKEAEKKASEDAETEEDINEETGTDDAGKAKDSALLTDSFETVKMNAEIISPGIQIPTFDASGEPKKQFRDCICGLRRKALRQGVNDNETSQIMHTVRGRALDANTINKMSCGEVRSLFNGVAAMKRNYNNGRLTADAGVNRHTQASTKDTRTPMEKFKDASQARWGKTAK